MNGEASRAAGDPGLLYKKVLGGSHAFERMQKRRLFHDLFALSQKNIGAGSRQLVIFSQDFVGHHVNLDGVFEVMELDCLFEWLSACHASVFEGIALDVGANIGNHAVYFSDYFEKVYAFEPNHRTFEVLKLNSTLASNITCFEVGISDANRTARMIVPPNNVGHASVADAANDASAPRIALRTLDSLIAPDEPVRLLKVDVEGHEHHALLGSERTIRTHRPLVLFEQLAPEFTDGRSAVIELLKDFGYRRFATVSGATNRLRSDHPFVNSLCALANRVLVAKSFYLGTEWSVRVQDHFPTKDYPFIVALPDWLEPTGA